MSFRIVSLVPFALAATMAASLGAQLPPHHAVVGTVSIPGTPACNQTGQTGVWFCQLPTPGNPGPFTPKPVQKLPPQLIVGPGTRGGAFSVLHRPSDGTLFVGDGADGNTSRNTLHLHILRLAGRVVQSSTSIPLARVRSGYLAVVGDLALLPDDRVLVAVENPVTLVPGSGPLATGGLWIFDPATEGFQSVPASLPVSDYGYSSAVSRDGTTAWIQTNQFNLMPPARIYEVNIDPASATFGRTTLCHTFSFEVAFGITASHEDILYVPAQSPPAPYTSTLYRIDPSTCTVTPLGANPGNVGLADAELEPGSGQLVCPAVCLPGVLVPFQNSLVTSDKSGNLSVVASQPAGGWAIPSSIDVNSSFDRYGVDSPRTNAYRIVDCPNPHGLPQIGNMTFGIRVQASGAIPTGGSLHSMLLGGAPWQSPWGFAVPGLGVGALVEPPWVAVPMAVNPMTGSQADVTLPIPNSPALIDVSLYGQSVHLSPAGAATSDAVRMTIF